MKDKKWIYAIVAFVILLIAFSIIAVNNTTTTVEPSNTEESVEPTEQIETTEGVELYPLYEDEVEYNPGMISYLPSRAIDLASGKIIYNNGEEKTWLDVYTEQSYHSIEMKDFYFLNGTTVTSAFNDNSGIAEIVIPEGVIALQDSFNNMSAICTVTFPTTLQSFTGCFKEPAVVTLQAKEDGYFSVEDNVVYADNESILYYYPEWKSTTEFSIPNTVRTIGQNAINDNEALRKIHIGAFVNTILDRGINNCPNVTEITLNDTIKLIKTSFNKMTNLKSFTLPYKCDMEGVCFSNCPNLTLTINENNEKYKIVDGVVYNYDMTELIKYPETIDNATYEMPDTVKKIRLEAFSYNKHIEEIIISPNVTELNTYFSRCTNLKRVVIPTSVKSIKTLTFYNLPLLTDITYLGTLDEWFEIKLAGEWISTSIEYTINAEDDHVSYKGEG